MFILFIYIAAGGVMWVIASKLAPAELKITFSRAFFTAVLLGLTDTLVHVYLSARIGSWSILFNFLVGVMIAQLLLRLSFLRTLLTVAIYWGVVIMSTFALGFYLGLRK